MTTEPKTFLILIPFSVEKASQKFSIKAQDEQEAIQFLKAYLDDDDHPSAIEKGVVIHSGYGHDLSDVGIHLVVEGEDFDEDDEDGYKRIDTTKRKKKRDQ